MPVAGARGDGDARAGVVEGEGGDEEGGERPGAHGGGEGVAGEQPGVDVGGHYAGDGGAGLRFRQRRND